MIRVYPAAYEINLGDGLAVVDAQLVVDGDFGTINPYDYATFAFPLNDLDFQTFASPYLPSNDMGTF